MTVEPPIAEELREEPQEPESARGKRAIRKPWIWVVILVVISASVIYAASFLGQTEEATPSGDKVNTAQVAIRDLVDETIYEGTLGRPVAGQLTAGISGTVTWVPEPGTTVQSGDVLFAIDDKPVLLLEGEVPVYRDLQLGSQTLAFAAGSNGVLTWLPAVGTILQNGDVIARVNEVPVVLLDGELPMYRTLRNGVEGQDVLQLEQALVDLGFDPDATVTIDEEFTSSTETMVESWQESLGVSETGRVTVGQVVFVPGSAQIRSHNASVGSSVNSGTMVLTASAGPAMTGADVLQLESALVGFGYDPGPVDGIYDIDTARAVTSWTVDSGHGDKGLLTPGAFIFNSGALRTAEVFADAGTTVNPSSPVISAVDLETIVRMALPAADQDLLVVGSSVVIVMPDRSETTGTVTFVSRVGTSGGQGNQATFAVEIALDDPSVAEGLDEAPVDIRAVSEAVENVLAVPVSALLALAEGGYAVEVVEDTGTRLVAVDPGFFADGWVEITGNVRPGDVVVVP